MIVTIVHAALPAAGARLARNLALLRARHGRKVLVLDAGPKQGGGLAEALERVLARHDDVVIDTDGDGPAGRGALIAAQVALVPLAPERADVDAHYDLIARLNHARMFNPGLRVLFVTADGGRDPAPRARCAMRAYAAQVMSAGVADAVLHLSATGAIEPGAAAMAALYEEVYGAPRAPAPAWRDATPDAGQAAGGRLLQKQGNHRP
jgi:chromosome partitioning protein